MYFLSDEERRLVLRRLLPEARRRGVAPELRGWSWDQAPLAPAYSPRLAMYEVSAGYCETGRDVYLRHVVGVKGSPSAAMIAGTLFHELLSRLILSAKKAIYCRTEQVVDALKQLGEQCPIDAATEAEADTGQLRANLAQISDGRQRAETIRQARLLWRFELNRILARVEEVLSSQPYIGPDSLAAMAVPVTVELKLNGAFLGLSPYLSTDAFVFSEPMIIDLKFGPRQPFDRLATTGYALVMESIHETPVDIGCVVYVRFKEDRVLIERDFHPIDDELRQWLIEARDTKARLVEEEIDPGLPSECYERCQYLGFCRGREATGARRDI